MLQNEPTTDTFYNETTMFSIFCWQSWLVSLICPFISFAWNSLRHHSLSFSLANVHCYRSRSVQKEYTYKWWRIPLDVLIGSRPRYFTFSLRNAVNNVGNITNRSGTCKTKCTICKLLLFRKSTHYNNCKSDRAPLVWVDCFVIALFKKRLLSINATMQIWLSVDFSQQ